ncbi:Aminoacyl-tRNA hydrolase [Ascochyta lentis]
MRFSSSVVLALPALAVAEQQIPLLDKVKGFFNQATASVASVIPSAPSVPSAPVEAAAAKAAAVVQYNLTLENWKEVLTVDPTVSAPATQEWLIFVTGGNSTCYGFCGPAEKAWNASVPVIAAQPSSPKLGFIDCERENILCNSWSVGAPSLIKFRIPKPLADQSAPVPEFRYKPLNRTSTTTETFKELVIDNQIDAIPPYEGLFHPFNGLLQQYGLAIPFGYATWGFSKMPSWLPMILISFFSRTFMSKRMNPGAAQQGGAAAPAAAR